MEQKQNSVKSAIYVSFILLALVSTALAVDLTVTRHAPATAQKGTTITINLTTNLDEAGNLSIAAITESMPDGTTVSDNGGGNDNDEGTKIEWILLEQSLYDILDPDVDLGIIVLEDQVISYSLTVPADYSGSTLTFPDLNITVTNDTYTTSFSGDTEITLTGVLGDINGDGDVSLTDLRLLAATFGLSEGEEGYDSRADFDGNHVIGLTDLRVLASNF